MRLAEFDLKMRGPGSIYGTQQSGYLDLKIADFSDSLFIKQVKGAVTYFMNHHEPNELKLIKHKIDSFRSQQVSRD